MKILIIHPQDITTDFLCEVYKDLDCTVIRSKSIGSGALRRAIKEHDRIICLGHGDPQGLLRDYIFQISYLITSKYVQLLRQKECVCIWCYADVFVKKYNIKGFCSGMIISEPQEALECNVPFNIGDVEKSNKKFAFALKKVVSLPISNMKEIFHQHYVPDSSIEYFNNENIFYEK